MSESETGLPHVEKPHSHEYVGPISLYEMSQFDRMLREEGSTAVADTYGKFYEEKFQQLEQLRKNNSLSEWEHRVSLSQLDGLGYILGTKKEAPFGHNPLCDVITVVVGHAREKIDYLDEENYKPFSMFSAAPELSTAPSTAYPNRARAFTQIAHFPAILARAGVLLSDCWGDDRRKMEQTLVEYKNRITPHIESVSSVALGLAEMYKDSEIAPRLQNESFLQNLVDVAVIYGVQELSASDGHGIRFNPERLREQVRNQFIFKYPYPLICEDNNLWDGDISLTPADFIPRSFRIEWDRKLDYLRRLQSKRDGIPTGSNAAQVAQTLGERHGLDINQQNSQIRAFDNEYNLHEHTIRMAQKEMKDSLSHLDTVTNFAPRKDSTYYITSGLLATDLADVLAACVEDPTMPAQMRKSAITILYSKQLEKYAPLLANEPLVKWFIHFVSDPERIHMLKSKVDQHETDDLQLVFKGITCAVVSKLGQQNTDEYLFKYKTEDGRLSHLTIPKNRYELALDRITRYKTGNAIAIPRPMQDTRFTISFQKEITGHLAELDEHSQELVADCDEFQRALQLLRDPNRAPRDEQGLLSKIGSFNKRLIAALPELSPKAGKWVLKKTLYLSTVAIVSYSFGTGLATLIHEKSRAELVMNTADFLDHFIFKKKEAAANRYTYLAEFSKISTSLNPPGENMHDSISSLEPSATLLGELIHIPESERDTFNAFLPQKVEVYDPSQELIARINETRIFQDVMIEDSLEVSDLKYEDSDLVYTVSPADEIHTFDGYRIKHVYQQKGEAPWINRLGSLIYREDALPEKLVIVAEKMSVQELPGSRMVIMQTNTDLTYRPYPNWVYPDVVLSELEENPKLHEVIDSYFEAMKEIASSDQDTLDSFSTAVLYHNAEFDRYMATRYYSLQFDVPKGRTYYNTLEALAHSDEGFYCQTAAAAVVDFNHLMDIVTASRSGARYHINGNALVNYIGHESPIIFTPNGSILLADMTPAIDPARTPQEDQAFLQSHMVERPTDIAQALKESPLDLADSQADRALSKLYENLLASGVTAAVVLGAVALSTRFPRKTHTEVAQLVKSALEPEPDFHTLAPVAHRARRRGVSVTTSISSTRSGQTDSYREPESSALEVAAEPFSELEKTLIATIALDLVSNPDYNSPRSLLLHADRYIRLLGEIKERHVNLIATLTDENNAPRLRSPDYQGAYAYFSEKLDLNMTYNQFLGVREAAELMDITNQVALLGVNMTSLFNGIEPANQSEEMTSRVDNVRSRFTSLGLQAIEPRNVQYLRSLYKMLFDQDLLTQKR